MKPIERVIGKAIDVEDADVLIPMTIDQGAMAHVMDVLTNLYSDVELAVIREYSTNAWDAHVEAENYDPIQVTLPSVSDPFFRVRDFGLGLDVDDIQEIYSRYGNSTKRGSNNVVGMLGMGCKSALAYTNEFFVNSVKDGIRISVNVVRDENGVAYMNVVSQTRTNEPSGTEVAVPVESKYDEWQEKAEDFYSYWETGSVLVNGEAPVRVDGLWLDGKTLIRKERYQENIIVMGNVSYPAGYAYGGSPYVAWVNIGDVEFAPSREMLVDSPHTSKARDRIQQHVNTQRDIKLREMINNAKSGPEAIEATIEAREMGLKGNVSWQGVEIPQHPQIVVRDEGAFGEFTLLNGVKYDRKRRWNKETSVTLKHFHEAEWFVGYTGKSISPTQENKLDQWRSENSNTASHYYLVDEINPESVKFIDPAKIRQWEEVKKVKLPREKKEAVSVALMNGVTQDGYQYGLTYEAIKPVNVMYLTKADSDWYTPNYQILNHHLNEYTVVTIGANQVNRLMREFPNARRVQDVIEELRQKWLSSLTEEDKVYLQANSTNLEKFKKLDKDRVDDPAIKQAIIRANQNRAALEEAHKIHRINIPNSEWVDPFEKYPLASSLRYYEIDSKKREHLYLYLNAAYASSENPSDEA